MVSYQRRHVRTIIRHVACGGNRGEVVRITPGVRELTFSQLVRCSTADTQRRGHAPLSRLARAERTDQHALAEHAHTHSETYQSIPRHHAETRHPGTADAAHRHAQAGLWERNGPKPARGARATRPATSQHRVGRRRTCDERRRTLALRASCGFGFQRRQLHVVSFYWYSLHEVIIASGGLTITPGSCEVV